MNESRRQPFVLKSRKPIPGHVPDPSRVFDPMRQLWISRDSGLPVVAEHVRPNSRQRSDWGETITTRTSEGVDQSEVTRASDWGETVTTKTSEGIDQSEGTRASEWGETVMTETSEGVDQSESVRVSDFGETVVTATSEGHDQSERISDEGRY